MHTDSLKSDLKRILDLGQVDICLRPEWNGVLKENRKLIRQHIFENIESADEILDMTLIPALTTGSISISHNRAMGGYVHISENVQWGFDIELTQRLTERNAKYYASPEEIRLAPSASSLWTAKEAAYKALPLAIQPTVIGEIELVDWQMIDEQWASCRIGRVQKRSMSGYHGVVYCGEEHTLAFFKGPQKQRMDA